MRQSTLESDFKKLYDLNQTTYGRVRTIANFKETTKSLREYVESDNCNEQAIFGHSLCVNSSATSHRNAVLENKQAIKAWKNTPAHRRKTADRVFETLQWHMKRIAHDYSGKTSYDTELTEDETTVETTTSAGERYTHTRFDRKTDAHHKVRVNINDVATLTWTRDVYDASQKKGMIPVRLKRVGGLAKAKANESVYEAAWVQCVRYRLVLKTGFIAYNNKERVEYHLEKGDAKKALTGLRRKITMSKSDPHSHLITPKKGKVTIGQVIRKTGWCRAGCEEFAERMLGRLSSTDKGYDVHRILRTVERIISKGDSHTYFGYAIKLKKLLGHAEVAAATKEVAV